MRRSALSVVFAGSGGAGAMTAGAIFLRSAAEAGYYGLMTQLFGPQVRGGESAALVQIGTEPIECQPDHYEKATVRSQREPIIGDRAAALAAAIADDGYSTGVLFKARKPVPKQRNIQPLTMTAIESEFVVPVGD